MKFPAYGVHFRHGADPQALVRGLEADGWRVFALDASRNKRGFVSEAARSLPLDPPVTMPNWDGLEDALRGGIGGLPDDAIAIVWRDAHLLPPRRVDSRLGAAGGDFVLAVPARELDQVLVQLEPRAVISVDAR